MMPRLCSWHELLVAGIDPNGTPAVAIEDIAIEFVRSCRCCPDAGLSLDGYPHLVIKQIQVSS